MTPIETDGLPHPLALVVTAYTPDAPPAVRAWRLCGAAEMLTRFLTAIALAEIAAEKGAAGFPPALRQIMVEGLEWPTFGRWAAILRSALDALPPPDQMLVPELRVLAGHLFEAIGSDADPLEDRILPLRNALVHDYLPEPRVEQLLVAHGHQARFEALWREPRVAPLRALELLGATDAGEWCVLRGVPARFGEFPLADPRRLGAALAGGWAPGTVVLRRRGDARWRSLFPLQAFGPVLHRTDGRVEPVTVEPASLMYARGSPLVQYTAFHPQAGHGDAGRATQAAFEALFPLTAWREAIRQAEEAQLAEQALDQAARPFRFRDVVGPLTREPFLGREQELDELRTWLERTPTGAGLVLGAPGMGKTTLAAQLSVALARERADGALCIRYFFRADDERCTARQFMTGVLLQLRQHGAPAVELPAAPADARQAFVEALAAFARERLGQPGAPRRLILLLDGVEDIVQRDPAFLTLVRGRAIPHVTWLCFARPEARVLAELPESAVPRVLGPEGLRPLDARAVREYLLGELGPGGEELLRQESRGGPRLFLDALVDAARRLPLYLRLLVEDLRHGRFRLDRPDQLPATLEEYYGAVVGRLSLDAASKVLPDLIALLAYAQSPLTEGMLEHLLDDHDLRGQPDWASVLQEALRLGHVLMRRDALGDDDTVGYALYHPSFGQYLRAGAARGYREFPLAPVLGLARRRLLRFAARWREWPVGSPARRYALLHAPQHVVDDGLPAPVTGERRALLDALLEGPFGGGFFAAVSAEISDLDALEHARGLATHLAQVFDAGDQPEIWPALGAAARHYATLAAAIRGAPETLARQIALGNPTRVLAAVEAEPDAARRVALEIAVAVLLEDAGKEDLAKPLWAHARAAWPAASERRGRVPVETFALLDALAASRGQGPAREHRNPDTAPSTPLVADSSPRPARLPWFLLPLAGLWYEGLLGGLVWSSLSAIATLSLTGMLLGLLGLAGHEPEVVKRGLQYFAYFMLAPMGLAIPLFLSARVWQARWLERWIARRMGGLELYLAAAPAEAGRRALRSVVVFQRWGTFQRREPPWLGTMARIVTAELRRRRGTPPLQGELLVDATALERGATASGGPFRIVDALVAELRCLSPDELTAVCEAALAQWPRAVDPAQLVRIICATADLHPSADILLAALRGPGSAMGTNGWNALASALPTNLVPAHMARAVLESLGTRPDPATRLGAVRWLWKGLRPFYEAGHGVPGRRAEVIWQGLLVGPFLLFMVATIGPLLVVLVPLAVLIAAAGRIYDPFGTAPARHASTVPRAAARVLDRLTSFGFLPPRGTSPAPLLDALQPDGARLLEATFDVLLAHEGDASLAFPEQARTLAPVLARLVRRGRLPCRGRTVLAVMAERPILDQIAPLDLAPPAPAPSRPIPGAGEGWSSERGQQLARVLPLGSAWGSWTLMTALSVGGLLAVLAVRSVLAPWVGRPAGLRVQEADWLIGLALTLPLAQHAYQALRGRSWWRRLWRNDPDVDSAKVYRRVVVALFLIAMLHVTVATHTATEFIGFEFFAPLLVVCVASVLAPELVARWRGAALVHPTRGELQMERARWVGLACAAIAVLGLAACWLTRV